MDVDFNSLEQLAVPNFTGGTLGDLFSGAGGVGIITYIFFFAGIALLIYLLYGGFQLMTSGGDPKKIASGKSIITNAFLGFIIIFVAYWIIQILGRFLGLPGIISTFI